MLKEVFNVETKTNYKRFHQSKKVIQYHYNNNIVSGDNMGKEKETLRAIEYMLAIPISIAIISMTTGMTQKSGIVLLVISIIGLFVLKITKKE